MRNSLSSLLLIPGITALVFALLTLLSFSQIKDREEKDEPDTTTTSLDVFQRYKEKTEEFKAARSKRLRSISVDKLLASLDPSKGKKSAPEAALLSWFNALCESQPSASDRIVPALIQYLKKGRTNRTSSNRLKSCETVLTHAVLRTTPQFKLERDFTSAIFDLLERPKGKNDPVFPALLLLLRRAGGKTLLPGLEALRGKVNSAQFKHELERTITALRKKCRERPNSRDTRGKEA